jgi:hypothetical protein
MSKLRHTLIVSLISGAMLAALAAPGALFAAKPPKEGQDHKVYICHFPPGNPENVQKLSIAKSALKKHEDHHDDYLVSADEECLLTPDEGGEGGEGGQGEQGEELASFSVSACIDRPGVRKGRRITASLSGRLSNSARYCDI